MMPTTFFICALVGYLLLSWHILEREEEIHHEHLKALEMASLSLPAPLWNFEQSVIDTYLATLHTSATIHTLRLYDAQGELLAELAKQRPAVDPKVHGQALVYSNALVSEPVGCLELTSTNAPLLEERNHEALGMLLVGLAIVLCLTLLQLWQVRVYILQPLKRAIDGLHQLERSEEGFSTLVPSRTREINHVIVQLNQLGGRVMGMLMTLRDNEKRYQHFYRDTPALLLVIDARGIIQDASQLLLEVTGWTRDTLVSTHFSTLLSHQQASDLKRIEMSLKEGHACSNIMMGLRCQHQDNRQVELVIPATVGDTRDGTMLLLTDITKLVAIQQKLMNHELTDPLTHLPNRLAVHQHVESLIAQDAEFCLLLINIDRFHHINHHLGPADGDRLLSEVSDRLRLCDPDWLGRPGGDEFVMTCDVADLPALVMRIEGSFIDPLLKAGEPIHLSLSIVGLEAQIEDRTPSRLLRLLERSMASVKQAGGNQYRLCARDNTQEEGEALFVQESMIRDALTLGWFQLHLQPIFEANSPNLDDPELLGAEALIRLEHPELGLVPPSEFISAAEKTGQIIAIGNWVLEEAAVILCDWQARGVSQRYLSVNTSVMQFRNNGVLKQLTSLLKRYPFKPERLIVEVTENLMLDSDDSLRGQLDRIRRLGVHLSLDDFGTGFSSLSYLHELPFGTLKVDRSFVMNVENSERDRTLAGVIVDMANSLGMSVVVEGIEQRGQAEIFRAMGVDAFQGFHFGRPMPLAAFNQRFSPTDEAAAGGLARPEVNASYK
ncbi:putative bifunctional diguanylate cyclase/phosphodiesterase [Cobetia amphilecti]|uniref:putative bifunctional diguanylate cyclase/phosphodiesterase n=1 Tax=Cobetia amphilecti TaxID=1055104 RepID=UPI001C08A939|nr:GGDEF domain-containing phosphodiesterase [Cobetia amphilecti]MBU3008221.1 EAL domain-containing protein [Cobetia amphilecti]